MELREWLIILGLALVSLIVIDGVRRLQRQRRVPRLDQAQGKADARDSDAAARDAELDWELPNGGARVVRPADYSNLTEKPPLERREPEYSGPSKVFAESHRSGFAAPRREPRAAGPEKTHPEISTASSSSSPQEPTLGAVPEQEAAPRPQRAPAPDAAEPLSSATRASTDTVKAQPAPEPEQESVPEQEQEETPAAADFALRAEADDARVHQVSYRPASRRQLRSETVGEYDDEEEEEYRLVDIEGMGRSMKKRLVQRRRARQEAKKRRQEEKARRAEAQAKEQAERQARKQQEQEEKRQQQEAQLAARAEQDRLAAEQARAEEQDREAAERQRKAEKSRRASAEAAPDPDEAPDAAYPPADDFRPAGQPAMEPVLEKALRNDVPGGHARKTLTDADELIVISVMSRDAEGFDGLRLLELLMACGLRYSQGLGVFHRFETESEDSELQFSMVNVIKPGSFPVEEGAPFTCPGITFLMPLPGAEDSATAFEAMVETAMVVVRHMGGELKDENHSVMTAQTIEFARQQVHEFERRHRLHRQLQAQ
ncbi:cell division protein ZipA C-terminal FtsZ-binding domain-containing protein [Halomonas piscis]|uniref:Cell division protein ZipA n=1 Tax=Halomonas piscis TaxID=3031727 RepID=A0ABY9YYD6_9GAMM|nr:cell division protein ZipA C-terminal FtsZ-binding domain-containing protein [Halomonas piscis]WNK19490.1 cell division protein ZipA C-terminal FtsZ-binding domain-containing protein [Halomonas piscis]